MKRHGVTARRLFTQMSQQVHKPQCQLFQHALVSEIKNTIQNNMYTGLTIENVNTLNYQRVFN